jgi:hypothetical protein
MFLRQIPRAVAVTLLIAPMALAFDSPLSSEAIREAYFLGQRRDDSMARYLGQYAQRLAPPSSGPYISSIEFRTPFAQLVRLSSQRSSGYSAQQAEEDHRAQAEFVEISIEILLTESYPAVLSEPARARSSSTPGYRLRSPDFWRDFDVTVFQGEKELEAHHLHGSPNYTCSGDAGCALMGATIWLDFSAAAFDGSKPATVSIEPPQGDPVAVEFDLSRLR